MANKHYFEESALSLYFNIPATLCIMGYRTLLLVALLAPMKGFIILGGKVSFGALLLPLSFSCLVIFAEVYGRKVAIRLVIIGLAIFALVMLAIVFLLFIPPAPTHIAVSDAAHFYAAIVTGFTVANLAIVAFLKCCLRIVNIWIVSFLVPFIGYVGTVVGFYVAYVGLRAGSTLERQEHSLIVITLLIILSVPVTAFAVQRIGRWEDHHQKQILGNLLTEAREMNR